MEAATRSGYVPTKKPPGTFPLLAESVNAGVPHPLRKTRASGRQCCPSRAEFIYKFRWVDGTDGPDSSPRNLKNPDIVKSRPQIAVFMDSLLSIKYRVHLQIPLDGQDGQLGQQFRNFSNILLQPGTLIFLEFTSYCLSADDLVFQLSRAARAASHSDCSSHAQ